MMVVAAAVGLGLVGLIPIERSWEFGEFDWDPGRESERVEMVFDVGDAPGLEVDNFAGDVAVQAGEGGTISVIAIKKAQSASNLERIEIDWEEGDSGLQIKTSRSQPRASNLSVEFEIIAPAGSRLDLHTGAGNVRIQDMTGEIAAHTGAGGIDVRGADGPVSLDTGAGNIEYEGTPSGDCSMETGAGNITLGLPADVNVEIDLDTGIGIVDIGGFDVDGQVSTREVRGVIGTGSWGEIYAHTGAGNIDLIRR
jgi:hypothetical protein